MCACEFGDLCWWPKVSDPVSHLTVYNTLQALYPHIIVPPLPMSDIFGELLWLCFIVLEEDSECLSWVGIALLSSPTHSLCLCGSLAVYLPDSSSSRCGRSCLFFGDGEAEQITVRNYDEYRVRLLSLFLRRVVRVPALRSCEFFRKFILAWDQEYTDAVHASQEAVKGLKRGLGTRCALSFSFQHCPLMKIVATTRTTPLYQIGCDCCILSA